MLVTSSRARAVCERCDEACPKRKTKRATRRDLFGELVEGMTALAEAREGKRTLRTHHLEFKPPPELSADDLIRVRKRLHLSRVLFANFLRTRSRTLEN